MSRRASGKHGALARRSATRGRHDGRAPWLAVDAERKCSPRSDEREAQFDRLARGRVRGLELEPFDPDAVAELGSRWPEDGTDRAELCGLLHDLAMAAGLLAR